MYVISINYRRAPLSVRGQLAFSKEEQIEFLKMCRESQEMGQSVLLSTCNRLELYTQFAEEEINPEAVRQEHFIQMEEALAMAKGVSSALCRKYVSCYHGEKALRHLHRVTSGIDSMVLGEDEILRQVKRAYQLAVEEKCAQYALHTIFQGAFTCAKRIKTKTALSKSSISIATLAAGYIIEFLKERGRNTAKVMIIGITGEIGSILMKNLKGEAGISVIGTSRQHGICGGTLGFSDISMIAYEKRYEKIYDCDVIVSATGSPHYTVTRQDWRDKGRVQSGRETLFVDLSVPADIDSSLKDEVGVTLCELDYFRTLAKDNNARKQQAKQEAEQMIEEELSQLQKELFFHRMLPELKGITSAVQQLGFEKLLYRVRDEASYPQLCAFFEALEKGLMEE